MRFEDVLGRSERSALRKKRPRQPMVGIILHQDASTRVWPPDIHARQEHDRIA
jgi:hypothetical protein